MFESKGLCSGWTFLSNFSSQNSYPGAQMTALPIGLKTVSQCACFVVLGKMTSPITSQIAFKHSHYVTLPNWMWGICFLLLNIIFFLHRSREVMSFAKKKKTICEIFYLHCPEMFLNVTQINQRLSYSQFVLTIIWEIIINSKLWGFVFCVFTCCRYQKYNGSVLWTC